MKYIRLGITVVLMLVAFEVIADPAKPASPATAQPPQAAQPAAAMPCGNTQVNCPMTSQPMGPGNHANMPYGNGPGMGNGKHQGMMGQGNQGYPVGGPKHMPAASGNDVIYGSQLMTPEERAAYHAKLSAAKTEKERNAIRAQHHKEMQERAKKLGKTLPPAPPSD
ncbi:MAG TPA: hypothetical protein VNF48_08310 [Gammaproteobacteria bacterium]|nr:hypothetical protein [Gammaproteobacteria bacterium]